jgi:hypothetical protein
MRVNELMLICDDTRGLQTLKSIYNVTAVKHYAYVQLGEIESACAKQY